MLRPLDVHPNPLRDVTGRRGSKADDTGTGGNANAHPLGELISSGVDSTKNAPVLFMANEDANRRGTYRPSHAHPAAADHLLGGGAQRGLGAGCRSADWAEERAADKRCEEDGDAGEARRCVSVGLPEHGIPIARNALTREDPRPNWTDVSGAPGLSLEATAQYFGAVAE